jgi:NAD(P) transhydrogenase
MHHYDLIVIGSGPAGRRAAIQAAKLKKSVLVVEKGRRVGGVCVHTGTIPSKTLRETVLNLSGWRERGFYGRAYRVKQDISSQDLGKRLSITLNHEVEILEHQFARNKVETIRGTARFLDPHSIEVAGEQGEKTTWNADRFILAVGTQPHRPSDIPFDGEEVTVIEPQADLLPFVDRELIDEFIHDMRDRGMILRFRTKVSRIERKTDCCIVHLDDGRQVRSEMVLFAAGRQGPLAASPPTPAAG